MVPCVQFLPVGWTLAKVTVNDGQSVLTLSHDRAGYAALVVRLTAACTPGGAVEGPSQTTGVRHYQRTESRNGEFAVTWYDQFPRWVCHQPVALGERPQRGVGWPGATCAGVQDPRGASGGAQPALGGATTAGPRGSTMSPLSRGVPGSARSRTLCLTSRRRQVRP
jgi:hypothetical protein